MNITDKINDTLKQNNDPQMIRYKLINQYSTDTINRELERMRLTNSLEIDDQGTYIRKTNR